MGASFGRSSYTVVTEAPSDWGPERRKDSGAVDEGVAGSFSPANVARPVRAPRSNGKRAQAKEPGLGEDLEKQFKAEMASAAKLTLETTMPTIARPRRVGSGSPVSDGGPVNRIGGPPRLASDAPSAGGNRRQRPEPASVQDDADRNPCRGGSPSSTSHRNAGGDLGKSSAGRSCSFNQTPAGPGNIQALLLQRRGQHRTDTNSNRQGDRLDSRSRTVAPAFENDSKEVDSEVPQLPEAWTEKMSGTMIIHTVQNAMRLANYLLTLLTGGYGTVSALHIACWEGSTDAVAAVTSGKSNVVKNWHKQDGDLTPLHIAAMCCHSNVVEYLLQMDVNADIPTVHGLRALHISASSSCELSDALVLGKADVSVLTADADTPLHYASCYEQLPTMELLLRAGADAAAANNFGVVPLHIAVAYAALEGLKVHEAHGVLLLLSHKAEPFASDKHGRTPADVAVMAGGDASLVDFLRGGAPAIARGMASDADIDEAATKLQDLAGKMMSDTEISVDPTAAWDSPPAAEPDDLEELGSLIRCDKNRVVPNPKMTGEKWAIDLHLAEENAKLLGELTRLNKELEDERSRRKHMDDLLKNTRGTMEQLQNAKATGSQSHAQNTEVMQQIKDDLVRERDEFRRHSEDMEEERKKWLEERSELQRQLDEALEARDSAQPANKELAASPHTSAQQEPVSLSAASVADVAIRPTSADLRAVEEKLGQKNAEFEQMFGLKEEELEARTKAENDAKEALGQKESELISKDAEIGSLRQDVEQRIVELDSKVKEVARLSATVESLQTESRKLSTDVQKQHRDREEVFSQLSDLRQHHTQLREEHANLQLETQQTQDSYREKALALEGQYREQQLCTKKFQDDLAESQAVVNDLQDCKERAERADRMLGPLNQRIEELHEAFAQEQALRKRYHNQMQEAKGAIRVYGRIRPAIEREAGEETAARRLDAFSMELDNKDKKVPPKIFNFDAVFDAHSTQEDVFSDCRGLVSSAVDGFNVTIFAYGQTGAGKTHTMYGNAQSPGLVPRIAEEIFAVLRKYAHEAQARVRCSMFELYKDDLVDIFLPKAKLKNAAALEIKKDSRGSVYVDNAIMREAANSEELLKVIDEGCKSRHVAATKMNADSSRSHLIAIITIESTNRKTKQVATGKLTLCDLAGSERLKKSEASGEQLREAQSINKSLSALGDVIEALTKHAKHVPYRNHKLTQLFSDSLGGNAKTLMFVNCSPVACNAEETGAALSYAARAKLIVNKVEKNQDTQEVFRLKKVIQVMSQELEQARADAGVGQQWPPVEPG